MFWSIVYCLSATRSQIRLRVTETRVRVAEARVRVIEARVLVKYGIYVPHGLPKYQEQT